MASNRLSRLFARCMSLPGPLRMWAATRLFGGAVKFFGTAGTRIVSFDPRKVVMVLRNRRKVQNHIRGIHATAMALLAESATGLVVGLNLPDDKLPLLKSMRIDYVKRAEGDLRAEATLSDEQLQAIASEPRGEVLVAVNVTDSAGNVPIVVEMIWAWRPKKTG